MSCPGGGSRGGRGMNYATSTNTKSIAENLLMPQNIKDRAAALDILASRQDKKAISQKLSEFANGKIPESFTNKIVNANNVGRGEVFGNIQRREPYYSQCRASSYMACMEAETI